MVLRCRARRPRAAGTHATIDRPTASPSSSTSGDRRSPPSEDAGRRDLAPSVGPAVVRLPWIILILVVVNLATIAAMLGSGTGAGGQPLQGGDRASGVFSVLAGGFAIFAGFIIFLAFTSYDQSRSGAETEAITVAQQFETAQFLPPDVRRQADRRAGLLRRSVVDEEWPQMAAGNGSDMINPWGGRPLPDHEGREAEECERAGRVRRSGSIRPSDREDGTEGSAARRRRHHSDLDLARADAARGRLVRVLAVLRRQR